MRCIFTNRTTNTNGVYLWVLDNPRFFTLYMPQWQFVNIKKESHFSESHLLRWKYYPANGFFCKASESSYRIQLSYNLRFYHPDYWYVLMCSNFSLLLTWILRTHISFLMHTVNSLSVWLKLRCWTCPRSLPTGIPLLWSLAMEQDINN